MTLNFVPSSIYAYTVGVNTLEIRGKLYLFQINPLFLRAAQHHFHMLGKRGTQ